MRTLLSIAVLMSTSLPAFAAVQLPEPESITLIAIGAVAMLAGLRKK